MLRCQRRGPLVRFKLFGNEPFYETRFRVHVAFAIVPIFHGEIAFQLAVVPACGRIAKQAVPESEVAPVRLSADSVELVAASTVVSPNVSLRSNVVIHDNATLSARDGTRLIDFKMTQEAAIDADSLPSEAQLGGSGAADYTRSFVSEAGTVTFGEAEADVLAIPEVDGVREDPFLSLTLDSARGTAVTTDLALRELTMGRGGLAEFNTVIGDLTTTGNLGIFGRTRLFDLVGETAPQRFESLNGSVTLERIDKPQGSLEIAAGGQGENPPINLEGDINIANGNLDIESGFSWLSSRLSARGEAGVDSEDGIDRGVLTIGPAPGQTFQPSRGGSGTQTLDARVIAIGRGVVIEKHQGSLDLFASNVDDASVDDPTATIDIDGVIRLVPDPAALPDPETADPPRVLSILAGGAVTLGDHAHLVADRITVRAARSGQTSLRVGEGLPGATSAARLYADSIGLEAGFLDPGAGEDSEDTTVSVAAGAEFRDTTGSNAPLDLIIRQGAPIAPADLPSLSQFGLAPLQDGVDAMIYQVEAAKSGMLIDARLADAVLDGTVDERAGIDLRLVARDGITLVAGVTGEADLNAALVTLRAGSDGTGDLVLEDRARIAADKVQFNAGDGTGGPSGARVILLGGIELRDGADTTAGPELFVFSQDASIDGTTTLPSLADADAFGTLPNGTEYVLQSQAGSVTIGDASVTTDPDTGLAVEVDGVDPKTLVGVDGGRGVTLTVNASRDVELIQSIGADRVVLRAGDEVLVGLHRFDLNEDPGETVTGVEVAADEIELNADVVGRTEGAVQIAGSVRFTDRTGENLPTSFALRQINAIGDADLPTLGQFQFGPSPPGDLTDMSYEIASFGAISLTDASRIGGSDLILVSAQGVTLGQFGPLQLGPLQLGSLTTCDGECDNSGARTELALLQSVTTQKGINLSRSVVIGGDGPRNLLAVNGDITIGDEVLFRGGDLAIIAAQGDVEVGGRISTSTDLVPFPAPKGDTPAPDVAGGDVTIRGKNVRLERVRTLGSTGEASGNIYIEATAPGGEVELRGDFSTLDALASSQGTAGDITVRGSRLLVGSETEEAEIRVELLGGKVKIDGDVVAGRAARDARGDPLPLHARELEVRADGDVSITGDVTIDTLRIVTRAPNQQLRPSVTLDGTLVIGSEPDVEVFNLGLLSVDAQGPVTIHGDITARETRLFADGELALRRDDERGDPLPITITSEIVRLRAGGSDPATPERLDLQFVTFGSTPERFEIQQEALFDAGDISALIDQIQIGGGVAAPRGSRLAFRSTEEGVTVNASNVNDTQLELAAADGSKIVVQGDLDVHTLDLDGDARVEGNLTVRFSRGNADRPAPGFRAAGDLDIQVQGDLTAYTVALFAGGADDQNVTIAGDFSAPALERERVPTSEGDEGEELGVVLAIEVAGSPISLLGSLGAREFSKNLRSANAGSGVSLEFRSDVVALGDVVADQSLSFEQRASFTTLHTPLDPVTGLPTGPVTVGLNQNVEATEGTLTIGNPIDKARGSLRLAGVSYEIIGSFDADGEQAAVRTTDDLTLSGSGVLTGGGVKRLLQSREGDVNLEGRLEFDGELVVEAGDVIVTGAEGATLVAGALELRSDVVGDGGLVLVADAIGFRSAAQEQRVEVASLELNPGGRGSVPTRATITRDGDLTLIASEGAFEMGSGEKLTATGGLVIHSAGRATLSDLSAMTIEVRASSIGIAPRAPGEVLLPPDGSRRVTDGGVDVVANTVDFSQTPDGEVTIGTPTASEISDALTGDRVLSRAIFPDLHKLHASDFKCGAAGLCDLVAQGSALVESSRLLEYVPPGEGPADYQLLHEVNVEGVSARPLWGQELLAYLERASTGGDRSSAEFDDPRLELPPVQAALRIYRGLFAPTEMYDNTTGARIPRSHRDRILWVLQRAEDDFLEQRSEPLSGENYLAYVATGTTHGEAMFYLSAIVDLTREASRAGVRGDDLRLFVRLLLQDVAPRRLGVESLADALPRS